MKGVHIQLGGIKDELKKINNITGYEDLSGNLEIFTKTGEA